jgi:hypothetical protein
MIPDIRNASDPPDGDLVKEVCAHFGLCMYLAQVFETGLINILTALETFASKKPTRQQFDILYAKHESFTFGQLMKALSTHKLLSDELMEEAHKMKLERDHLAHRYFRDHAKNFVTVGGCHFMIEDLEARRDRFDALEQRVSDFKNQAFSKLGFDPQYLEKKSEQIMDEMLEQAKSSYSSEFPKKPV